MIPKFLGKIKNKNLGFLENYLKYITEYEIYNLINMMNH